MRRSALGMRRRTPAEPMPLPWHTLYHRRPRNLKWLQCIASKAVHTKRIAAVWPFAMPSRQALARGSARGIWHTSVRVARAIVEGHLIHRLAPQRRQQSRRVRAREKDVVVKAEVEAPEYKLSHRPRLQSQKPGLVKVRRAAPKRSSQLTSLWLTLWPCLGCHLIWLKFLRVVRQQPV